MSKYETVPANASAHVATQVHAMITRGEFLPGQQIRQENLATRLGVSRVPVREALKVLENEGIVTHEPYVGYTVTKLKLSYLREAYYMREAVENSLLRKSPRPSADVIRELNEINDRVANGFESGGVAAVIEANHDFHFAMFRASGLDFMVRELERLWRLTSAYRFVHRYDAQFRERMVADHHEQIDAFENGDVEHLIELLVGHRNLTLEQTELGLAPMMQ
ncbi:DNA-binding GntR family transcriptional regulator [Antricoccus suffuscus]|uniref:DNA-binding GntR family transcriptional regulator n=1 Tax=Antricoccus suffuscus TaxID=1629062 RepID=A0A2T1A4R9_9ACTN|nr:GntR family transcriptional regulator [Antricoccus suffuscus]PRZ43600.1 DNA-binding GntR family transcriptional regulator [Antricoccus suffuscus]